MVGQRKSKPKPINWPVFDLTGEEKGQLTLPGEIFGAKINPVLMAQAVRVYLANQRQGGAKTKSRGEVRGSGRKIWRQKGTGRARHGDRYAPIFVGGGVAHGPRGNQNYHLKLTKKMKQAALRSALSAKVKEKEIILIDGLEKIEPKTKKAEEVLTKIFKGQLPEKKKHLLILPDRWEKTIRAFRNLPFIEIIPASNLNCYFALRAHYLIFAPESIDQLVKLMKRTESNGG